MNVSYLGPKGTFSEIAVAHHFSKKINKHPKSSIEDVFKSVEESEVDYGVVPIENSIEGSVNNTLDLLSDCKVLINGEIEIIINQCLLSQETDLKSVKRIDFARVDGHASFFFGTYKSIVLACINSLKTDIVQKIR